ncbi:MAG: TRAP transporter substrate-binding protein [Pseudomonadota bacterium]
MTKKNEQAKPTAERRKFLGAAGVATAGAVAAASSFPAPALAQERRDWKMVTSWPKGLPGLGTGAQRLADTITALSGGRITVTLFAGGELVPPLEVFDAVANNTAEMGHDASYYHIKKSPATAFFTTVPMGLVADEINAWLYWGGGQELWDELYDGFGLQAFPAGNTGCQMGGWYRKEITSPADFDGLKFRMPGLGGLALQKMGATVVLLPGSEIFQNLQSGAIDGTEWVGPYNDLSLGFFQVAPFYYWPGFHEPGATLECVVNKSEFSSLPSDLQELVRTCCKAENDLMLAEFNGRSAPALKKLVTENGVKLRQFPRSVLEAFGNASGEVMEELVADGDAITKKVADAFFAFRSEIMAWTRISDQGFTNARLLPYTYPKG